VAVVTVSRQYGAGGRRVASGVAEALGYVFVDREVAEEAARRMGLDPEVASAMDERAPAIVEEVGMALAAATPGYGLGHMPELDERALGEATRRVIVSLAEAGRYVILGRGAQAALADRIDAFHLSLVADIADRVRRIAEWQHVDEKEAALRCERNDSERAHYVRRFYGRDIRDPLLYDCVLNTSRLTLDAAVAIAVDAAGRKLRH
jgi:cytidylate kinase